MPSKRQLNDLITTVNGWIDFDDGDGVCISSEAVRGPLTDLRDLAQKELAKLSASGRKRKFATDAERYAHHNEQRKKKAT